MNFIANGFEKVKVIPEKDICIRMTVDILKPIVKN
jgi:hypothetical protein